ncbi:MAG: S8 family serine peptidase [Planctomycetes bacterium]|nr:S8 family serine peptidase [Planctomycetota bacterium]
MLISLSVALAAQSLVAPTASQEPRSTPAIIGTPEFVELALDDSIPLPNPPQVVAGDLGDQIVAPASGDPYFLSFAPGAYYPPAGERIDAELAQRVSGIPSDGRPLPETYAFVMFDKRITEARVAALTDAGARVLSFHPHYCLKVALSPTALDALAGLDFVRWVGVAKTWQKLHPTAVAAREAAGSAPLDLWINVFDSDLGPQSTRVPIGVGHEADADGNVLPANDAAQPYIVFSNGWQQRALEELGVEVLEYVDEVRAFRVRVAPERVEALLDTDFVQFIEAYQAPQALHDESMPLVNADRTRASYDGATATAGVIDSGMNFLHLAIDPYVIGWEYSTDNTLYWDDQNTHGTHVSGTMLGNGDIEDSYTGAAPGLGADTAHRVFVAKILNAAGFGTGVSISAVYTQMRTAYTDSNNVTTSRPMVVNNSYGTPGGPYYGTETEARLIDDTVYDWDQLYVFAAGNSGSSGSTMLKESSSKNALSVGSVYDRDNLGDDPGTVAVSSSRGPTDDLRWKPNLCAPGNSIYSCDANNTSGYTAKTGTSMAAPHVTGIAAQLCDRYSFLRYNPAALSAVMMAGSITKDNATLATPSTDPLNHLNVYGTGRIDAYKAWGGDSQQSMYFWSFGQSTAGYGQLDFDVNAGATRVTVVMHYKEESASSGAGSALINDLDMWIDAPPLTAGGNTGEYSAQQSPRDNTEIRIVNSPTTGTWRIKVFPDSVVAGQTCKVGVCAIVTYADTTPTPTYSVTTSDAYVQPNQNTTITASYTNPSYIASGVFLDSTSSGDTLQSVVTTLEDGATADLTGNTQLGRDVLLGNIVHGTNRYATWTTNWATEGAKSFSVQARSDNATDVTDAVTIYVDGTPPPVPTNLVSTTHTPLVWSNQSAISFQWTQPADNVSGVDGYSWTLAATNGLPNATKDIGAVTSYVTNFNPLTDTGTWWFSIRPVDLSGNWSTSYARVGPFLLDFIQPNYVTGLTSPSHATGTYSCNGAVTMTWDPCSDSGGSGLAGFSYMWDHLPVSTPDASLELGASATSVVSSPGVSAQPWYFHIRPYDNAGNGQNQFNYGPLWIVSPTPQIYCTAKTNSLGCTPSISTTGSPSKSAGNLVVSCNSAISQKNGLLFWGFSPSAAPFQGGTKCVGSPTVRTPTINSGGSPSGNDCSGAYSFGFTTAYMNSVGIDPGDTLYAQWWMRDPASASTTGLSNAVQFTVCQ